MSTEICMPEAPAAVLLATLRVGAAEGQCVGNLAYAVGTTPRAIRNLVDELIEAGHPVCAHPTTGYFLARTTDEVEGNYAFLRARAMHSLRKARLLREAALKAGLPPAANDDDFDPTAPEAA